MVSVTGVEGTNEPLGVKVRVVGVVACHEPSIGGDRVGQGLSAPTGEERVTVIVVSGATLVAPDEGDVLTMSKGGTDAASCAADADEPPPVSDPSARSASVPDAASRARVVPVMATFNQSGRCAAER
jgi:hypothetical protein